MYQDNPLLTSYVCSKPQHMHAVACRHQSIPKINVKDF